MKTAPFEEDSDDVIAFVTEVQLAFTFFVGFALLTDNKETPFFNADVMDVLLVVVNCFGFVTLIMGNCYQQECHNCTKHKERIEAVIEMHEQRKISKLKPPMINANIPDDIDEQIGTARLPIKPPKVVTLELEIFSE